MRWFLPFAALALTIPGSAMAQDANGSAIAEQQAAMKRFAWMQGVWRGPAKGVNRSGPYTVTQTERIGPFLSGTVIVMEGKGYSPDGKVGFNAFGILSYDAAAKGYRLHSYALGHAGDFTLTPTENGYVWEIPAGPGATIRYTATFAAGTWTEVGDYVAGSQPPRRIFEMTLKRVGDTDWPEGGGVPRD
jgi:hypothetical protein